jgi:hypothetical protein
MKKILTGSALLIIFCCFIGGKHAEQGGPKVQVKEISYGICKTKTVQVEETDNSPSGHHIYSEGFNLIKRTDTIPGELGVTFGMEFILSSKTTGTVNIEKAWIFPHTITDDKGKEFKEIRYTMEKTTNEITYATYTLEKPFEIVKGQWAYQLSYNGKLIYERKFYIK